MDKIQKITLLIDSIEKWNKYLKINSNLSEVDLHGAYLSGYGIDGSTDLQSADLSGANLNGVNLNGVGIRGDDLKAANLHDINLNSTHLRNANLIKAIPTHNVLT